ncbi:unnamed protein product [Didymodactylos carnosus]|uniref:Uncharacterized protein n=1 Tax=Didymodactylos carnosus TaxID=1234261 RepID=A0A813Z074_9BILA|nr:unnamed protein product [Didymodactylos carnosus]CAF1440694.1 unnamed protein product [Didymodactylos carnosus]CAF3676444.1 unnamed protein product [Didymodactylos carnosus]CAF4237053.1 unnamed protein product [Didymodactylos carnosus]
MAAAFDYLCKIVVVGESGVGKTALTQRFVQKPFCTDFLPTIGIDFQSRTINLDDKQLKLVFWDTAGQENFRSLVNNYFRGATGVLICFAITNYESFKNLSYWLEQVHQYCSLEIVILIVGTKLDLESERCVSQEEAELYAQSKNLQYIELSSKSDDHVQHCIETLCKCIIARRDRSDTAVTSITLDKKPEKDSSKTLMCYDAQTCS